MTNDNKSKTIDLATSSRWYFDLLSRPAERMRKHNSCSLTFILGPWYTKMYVKPPALRDTRGPSHCLPYGNSHLRKIRKYEQSILTWLWQIQNIQIIVDIREIVQYRQDAKTYFFRCSIMRRARLLSARMMSVFLKSATLIKKGRLKPRNESFLACLIQIG